MPSRVFAAAVSLAMLVPAMPAAAQDLPEGKWRNPQNSVHVRLAACGEGMCGTVVWANEEAMTDARKGGTPQLVGTQLFRDFRQRASGGIWDGKVFVPDLNRTFTGTVRVVNATTITGKGCILGGLICKSQTWTRLP